MLLFSFYEYRQTFNVREQAVGRFTLIGVDCSLLVVREGHLAVTYRKASIGTVARFLLSLTIMRFIYILLMLFSTLCANAQLISAVRDCKGQRELGELEGTYIYPKAFQGGVLRDAYIQCWRTNALTPKGEIDSLTISNLETYCFTDKIDGKEMHCKCVFHDRIVLKGLKIFYQRYKEGNKINKEPKYFIMGTYERWVGDFDLNYGDPFVSYDKKNILILTRQK